jgi:N-acetylmuramoyl-L-alanine amidase
VFSQNDQNFTIILDAGHGGKDPGKFIMVIRDIALKLLLKSVVLERIADFKVIYTRTTDVFYQLANRPKLRKRMLICLFLFIVIQ